MAYCKVRQAEIHYEEFGEGKPIIMIHGYTPDHRSNNISFSYITLS